MIIKPPVTFNKASVLLKQQLPHYLTYPTTKNIYFRAFRDVNKYLTITISNIKLHEY